MSKTFELDKEINFTFFYGGNKKGKMVQITGRNEKGKFVYVQLTYPQMEKIIKIYKKNILK